MVGCSALHATQSTTGLMSDSRCPLWVESGHSSRVGRVLLIESVGRSRCSCAAHFTQPGRRMLAVQVATVAAAPSARSAFVRARISMPWGDEFAVYAPRACFLPDRERTTLPPGQSPQARRHAFSHNGCGGRVHLVRRLPIECTSRELPSSRNCDVSSAGA